MENQFFHTVFPKKPIIRKLGTIKCDVVESTPIVFKERLYRLEWFRPAQENEANHTDTTYLHFVDVLTNRVIAPFAYDHLFGTAFTEDGVMYVAATRSVDHEVSDVGFVDFFRSSDLVTWEQYASLSFPEMTTCNTGICKKDGKYYLLTEVDKPRCFTFRFAVSDDLVHWTHLPFDHHFQDGRYAGGPAIYTLPDDPYFYLLYLEAYPGSGYANCIARSKDLIAWEYSPINPVLMYDEYEDKKIASPFLTEHERIRIDRALDVNNSDLELCDFNGRTVLYYSWGNQMGNEYLAEACYEGSMSELLRGFFKEPETL